MLIQVVYLCKDAIQCRLRGGNLMRSNLLQYGVQLRIKYYSFFVCKICKHCLSPFETTMVDLLS